MPIKRPLEIDRLIDTLRGGTEAERAAAVARLRIVGARALDKLMTVFADASAHEAQAAALDVIDASEDGRAPDIARRALQSGNDALAMRAAAMLRPWVTREAGTKTVEALVAVAADVTRSLAVRRAAAEALTDLSPALIDPLVRELVISPASPPLAAPDNVPRFGDPEAAREWLATHHDAPLSALHGAVTQMRSQGDEEERADVAEQWRMLRGKAHVVLAKRGSTVALYDLREAIEAELPPALDFLLAVRMIGDESCLEPLARAWDRVDAGAWARPHLVEAAQAIVQRCRLTSRSALVKRLRAKYPGFV